MAYRLHLLWAFVFRPHTEGVWVAVWCENKLLVIRNAYRRRLTLPGGGIDRGESFEVAAARELREEVALDVAPEQLSFVGQYHSDVEYKHDTINLYALELPTEPSLAIDRREVVYAEFVDPYTLTDVEAFPALCEYVAHRRASA